MAVDRRVDPELAARVRQRLFRELEDGAWPRFPGNEFVVSASTMLIHLQVR
jgi:hypothetical protein